VAPATPLAKIGWSGHSIFGQGVASQFGGGQTTPVPKGVVRPPPKGLKKKKKMKNGYWAFWGWSKPPLKAQFPFFVSFFWPFGGGRTTPIGVVRPPPDRPWGATPDFQPFFFRFSSLKKKKKGQNDVVLGWVDIIILESIRSKIGIFCTK
jgi:hypothetical protein